MSRFLAEAEPDPTRAACLLLSRAGFQTGKSRPRFRSPWARSNANLHRVYEKLQYQSPTGGHPDA
jgi:hypothetical protein